MAVPLTSEGQKMKMMAILRSVMLLNKQFQMSDDKIRARIRDLQMVQVPLGENHPNEGGRVMAIKRKSGYNSEAEQREAPMDQSMDWSWMCNLAGIGGLSTAAPPAI